MHTGSTRDDGLAEAMPWQRSCRRVWCGHPGRPASDHSASQAVLRHPRLVALARYQQTGNWEAEQGSFSAGLPHRGGHWCYPALQSDERGRALPHLRELLELLAGTDNDRHWRPARWLAAPAPYLPENVSAAQWLRQGGDPEPVLAAARADARRWAA